MSRPSGWIALLAMTALTPGLTAQAADVQRLEERVETLRAAYRDVATRARQFNDLMRQPEEWVEISEGHLHLFVKPPHVESAREAAREAARSVAQNIGPAADLLPTLEVMVDVTEQLRAPRVSSFLGQFLGTAQDPGIRYRVSILPWPRSRDARERPEWYSSRSELGTREDISREVTDRLIQSTHQALDNLLGDSLQFWTDQHPIRPAPDLLSYRDVYRVMVVSPFGISQRCLTGDNAACLIALDLDKDAPDWTDWYVGEDLRALARHAHGRGRLSPEVQQIRNSCLAGDYADCRTFMEVQYRGRRIGGPLPVPTRASLVQTAFEVGGEGAYQRLLTSSGSVANRLAITAGVPIDTLLDTWRRAVHGAAGEPVTTPFRTAVIALTWTLVFAYFGLRSTQWR